MDPWELITMAIRDLHLSQIAPTSMNFFQAPNGMFGDFWKSKKCNVNLNRNNKNFDQNKNIFSTFSWTIPTVMATCDASPVQGTSMSENCLVVADFIVFWWSSIGFTTDNCSAPLSTRASRGLQSIWNNILISKTSNQQWKNIQKNLRYLPGMTRARGLGGSRLAGTAGSGCGTTGAAGATRRTGATGAAGCAASSGWTSARSSP